MKKLFIFHFIFIVGFSSFAQDLKQQLRVGLPRGPKMITDHELGNQSRSKGERRAVISLSMDDY